MIASALILAALTGAAAAAEELTFTFYTGESGAHLELDFSTNDTETPKVKAKVSAVSLASTNAATSKRTVSEAARQMRSCPLSLALSLSVTQKRRHSTNKSTASSPSGITSAEVWRTCILSTARMEVCLIPPFGSTGKPCVRTKGGQC